MGDSLVLIVENVTGKGREGARLEAHRKYIDVQYVIPGQPTANEELGWRPTATCEKSAKFDEAKDIGYIDDQPQLWFTLPAGYFVVFFPSDAHAPLAGKGDVRKAVVKVAVNW
jgi:YhcH/YjgK/YiaL family protein